MIKPKKDNIVVGFEGVDFISTPDDETKQQLLDDYEKARKWDRVIKDSSKFAKECDQNQKIRGMIEKRVEDLKQISPNGFEIGYLQKLLKESKA